jgi:hypothetical protein
MGCASRRPMRRLQLVITILAMIGMELDVLCHSFSPFQALRWSQPSDPDGRDANNPGGGKALGSAGRDAFVEGSTPSGQKPDRTKNRPKLNKLTGMHLLVALRSKTRLSDLPLTSVCFMPVCPLKEVLPGYGSERYFPHPRRISLLHQLCRMLC